MSRRAEHRSLLVACIGACFLAGTVAAETPISQADDASNLQRSAAEQAAAHSPQSGFLVLDGGRDALLERLTLLESAERTIDAQYYIWNSDVTGRYLAQRLLVAADRGVRVRILLDDINVRGRDAQLVWLDSHPRIEVRIFNPSTARSGAARGLSFVRNFARLNRRMHNKSFTVDSAATIVGGRNIGDEYFDANRELNFRDRDLLAIGPVVAEAQDSFEQFWNSAWTRPVTELAGTRLSATQIADGLERVRRSTDELVQLGYEVPAAGVQADERWRSALEGLIWAPAQLVHDRPPTDTDGSEQEQAVAAALRTLAAQTTQEVVIESAYFILGDAALDLFAALHGSGVRVRALTNSLASNDLTTNHSGYARRRRQMLAAGIELYELRPDAASCRALVAVVAHCSPPSMFGLHAKSAVFDRRIVYVGSFNVNLRSAFLNTETALIIDSPELAQQIAASIEENMSAENSWHVAIDERRRLLWTTDRDGQVETDDREPRTGWWRRRSAAFYGLFPLEKYL